MIVKTEEFKNSGITSDILKIINESPSPYFNTRGIRFELFKQRGLSLRGKPQDCYNIYNDSELKMYVTNKIGHVVRKLKALNLIVKISNTTWKLLDNFDIDMEYFYPKQERLLMSHG